MIAIMLASIVSSATITKQFSEAVYLGFRSQTLCVEFREKPNDAQVMGTVDMRNWYALAIFPYRAQIGIGVERLSADSPVPDYVANVSGVLAIRVQGKVGAVTTVVRTDESCRRHLFERYGDEI